MSAIPTRSSPGREEQAVPATDSVVVRVWQLPVRIVHWTIFFSVVVLSVTGFYIGTPFVSVGADPRFVMGWARELHVLAAAVFIAAIVARVIWAFSGNRWANWRQFVPVEARRRRNAWEGLKYYLFVRREPPPSVGHNALAGLTYLVVLAMFLLQTLTGLALLGLESEGWMAAWFGWVFDVSPIPVVRLVHHLVMWLTWGFVVHHVYSAVLVDVEERSGLVSSMLTGWKRLPTDRL